MTGNRKSIAILVGFAFRADPWRSVGVVILTIADTLGATLFALWLKFLIDGAVEANLRLAMIGAAGMTVTIVIHELANWISGAIRVTLEERTAMAIDLRLMELSGDILGIEHHERPDYVKEMQLLREQRSQLSGSIGALVFSLGVVVQSITTSVLLATLHPTLLLLPVFAIPSLLAAGRAERIREKRRESTTERMRTVGHLFELTSTAAPAKEIRIFGLGDEINRLHQNLWGEISAERKRADIQGAVLAAGGWLVFAVGYVAAITLIMLDATRGEATPGDLLLALNLAAQVNQQVTGAVGIVSWLIRSLKVVGRYLWLKDYAKTGALETFDLVPVPDRIAQGIGLENVSFTYPGTDTEILRDINLHIPAGCTVAIVGDNGAGKTTLVKLLSRFYEPTLGRISVDGIDLKDFEPVKWRARTSAGFQDFVQYELIARETVGIGDLPSIEKVDAIEGALSRAGAEEIPASLPEGLETQLGRRFDAGSELSTGQWQKLALGRAMMRPAPLLLVLDEPTASLDAMTEHALFERYAGAANRLARENGAITVLVSHRFSTVRMADLIVVIEGGRVAETGSHQQLMSNDGPYAELYELQARSYR